MNTRTRRQRRQRQSEETEGGKRPVIKDPVALAKALLAVEDDPADCPPTLRRGRKPRAVQQQLQALPKIEDEELSTPGSSSMNGQLLLANSILSEEGDDNPDEAAKRPRLDTSEGSSEANEDKKPDPRALAAKLLSCSDTFFEKKSDPRALAAALLAVPDDDVPVRKIGRKRKLSVEEKMLLAQLHHDHFTIYHSKRYTGPDYIEGPLNLKKLLLEDWAKRLSELGICQRTPIELGSRISEMIAEVAEYRSHTNIQYKLQMANYQMSPSFLLFNKVFEYINMDFDRVEEILDNYERKVVFDREEDLIEKWQQKDTEIWTEAERKLLVQLFTANAWMYSVLMIRKKDQNARGSLLTAWASQISALGTNRSAEEIEAKIYEYRHNLRLGILRNPKKRQQRSTSPTADLLYCGFEGFTDVDLSWDVDLVLKAVRGIQHEILREDVKPEREDLVANIFDPHVNSCRMNRPHMSRREKHLLGLLYRKHHEDYEMYNHPHAPRKNKSNRKWWLLKEWAAALTSLGVSLREPEELATKISQYKNIIKTHKQCMQTGVESLTFKSEYKMRRCLRPLSPTTKMFDITDDCVEEAEFTDEAITQYIKESQDIRYYPFAPPEKPESGGESTSTSSPAAPSAPRQVVKIKVVRSEAQPVVNSSSEDIHNTVAFVANGSAEAYEDALAEVKTEPMDEEDEVLEPKAVAVTMGGADSEETNFQQVFEGVYNDCKTMERLGIPALTYDSVCLSGHVSKLAITREEANRDINYFIWNKYMEVELDRPLTFYVCHMCELMATPGVNADGRRGRQTTAFIPNGALLAQQSLPTVALNDSAQRVNISWAKMPPKHRCVPFLMSTMCEKLAALSHMLIRTSALPSE